MESWLQKFGAAFVYAQDMLSHGGSLCVVGPLATRLHALMVMTNCPSMGSRYMDVLMGKLAVQLYAQCVYNNSKAQFMCTQILLENSVAVSESH